MIVNAATFRAILRNVPNNALRPIVIGDLAAKRFAAVVDHEVPINGTYHVTNKDTKAEVWLAGDDYALAKSLAVELYNAAGDITLKDALLWIVLRSYEEELRNGF
ncbi:hypothetical protein CJ97_gp07 [Ralstonia phage RSB2]|uniref:Uncharacterized protein ORF7 n=1 Tax=Ralstonia phage RSB2 TaxID=913183 RepID=E5RUY7_9CAUD|nr:hypothetical protein CJ97_gp07 [Ralstonia phage RSB2]BAJ51795.1 hypothetical protein [Ralstonia phage RSB2]